MESSILKKAGRFLHEQGKNNRWRKVLTVLGAIVVFVTAYILLMPAVALERKEACELEEHTHTEKCYGQVTVCGRVGAGDETGEPVTLEFACAFPEELHVHTRECYDRENKLICGYADYAVHTHTNACYEAGKLVCALDEIEEHEHTENCYRINDSGYICGQEEAEAHTHKDACYTEYRELVCEKNVSGGHAHTDDCYTEEWELVCGQEDDPDHVHDEAECYRVTKKLTCGEAESEGHQHSSSCYEVEKELTCGKEENPNGHKHTEGCRGVVKELACGKDEVIVHEHTVEDDCYEAVLDDGGKQMRDDDGELLWTLVCEKIVVLEHVHGEECFREHEHTEECFEEGLMCGLEEHIHTEECQKGEVVFYCVGRIHAHVDGCYDSEGNEICDYGDFVVHSHEESCYNEEGVLNCPLPEIAEHTHTEECYNSEGSLVCELPQVHLHTHTDVCYDGEGNLRCGRPEVREHHHSDACYSPTVRVEEEEEELYTKTCEGDGYIVTVSYRADANIPEEAELTVEQITQEENEAHYAERQAQFQKTLKDDGATIRALLKIGFYLDGEEIEPESDITVTVQLLDENGLAEGGPVTVVHFAKDETEVLDGSRVKDSSTTFQMGSFSEIAIGYRTGEEESAGIYVSQSFEYEDDAYHMTFYIEGNAQFLDKEEETLPAEEDTVEDGDEEQAEEPEESGEDSEEDEAEAPEEETDSEEGEPSEEEPVMDEIPEPGEEDADLFEFQVKPLERDSEEYDVFLDHALKNEALERLVSLQVFDYSLTYGGRELDLTNCEVTVEITTAPELEKQVERSIPEAVTYLMNYKPEAAESVPEEISEEIPEETAEPDALSEEEPQAAEDEVSEEEASGEIISDEESGAVEGEVSEKETAGEEIDFLSEDEIAEMPEETELIISVAGMAASAFAGDDAAVRESLQIDSLGAMVYSNDEAAESSTGQKVRTIVDGPVALSAVTTENPHFIVQYYAYLNVLSTTGTNELKIIDTSGKNLPKNGNTTNPSGKGFKSIYVDSTGKIQTETELKEVYVSRSFEYHKAPTINYFNALIKETNKYEIKEIWLLKSGKDAESIDENDWDVFPHESDVHFANCWPKRDRTEEVNPRGIAFDASAKEGTKYESDLNRLTYTKTATGYTAENWDSGNVFNYIVINDGAVIRLVYDTVTKGVDFASSFYDYDISNGWIFRTNTPTNYTAYNHKFAEDVFSGDTIKADFLTWAKGNPDWDGHIYTYTKLSGINSGGNYSGSGTKLAFGNVNTGTTLGKLTWSKDGVSNELNKYNNKGYKGCTFGLVTGMSGGKIQYASGVQAPKLFNEGSATGKTSYNNGEYSLQFSRVGDTHTLTTVNGTGATNLGNFSHPTNSTGTHTDIWTNNFWPMDSAPSFGTTTKDKDGKNVYHDVKFGGTATFKGKTPELRFGPTTEKTGDYTFPESDDGRYHNSYFGMQYEVGFELSPDYVGPLEYYFFGDDDMWVFLDGKLVCDIGGVHSSVGEYVQLWDYLHKHNMSCYDENGTLTCDKGSHEHDDKDCYGEDGRLTCDKNSHTLSFFYTERGASGSTCWMQFTLPSASSITPEAEEEDYGRLRIEKEVGGISNLDQEKVEGWDSGDGFNFTIELTDKDGNRLPDNYSYTKYDKNGNELMSNVIVWDGGAFHLKNGEYIIVRYLPADAIYTITEENGAVKYKSVKNEKGEEFVEDGSSDYYYFTDIVADGSVKGTGLTDETEKKVTGSVVAGAQGEVKYINRVLIYELPESGGPGTNLYTMAGISLLLIACLMYRKKFKEGGKSSSTN